MIPNGKLRACLRVLYEATLIARCLGWEGEREGLSAEQAKRLARLMDAVHNLPFLILNWDECNEERLINSLALYDKDPIAFIRLRDVFYKASGGLADTYRRIAQENAEEVVEEEDPMDPGLSALRVVAEANVVSAAMLLRAADDIEKHANNGYYDDDDGAALLKQIAAYLRKKAV